uniref:Ovule protein n=1 Tax=Bursaphelenchus xylophilus TaxID=6326 RepID=A0A1I7S7Q8_BURXY
MEKTAVGGERLEGVSMRDCKSIFGCSLGFEAKTDRIWRTLIFLETFACWKSLKKGKKVTKTATFHGVLKMMKT